MNTDNPSNDLEGVLRRIRKMLAMANDGRGDPNEAAAAAAQAEKLMRKFNLDHADVLAAELKRGGAQFARMRCSANMKRDDPKRTMCARVPLRAGFIAFRVAKLNDCQAINVFDPAKNGACVEFRGLSADVQVAGWMFDYLVGELIRGAQNFNKERTRSKTEGASYRAGFTNAITSSLRRMEAAKEKEFATSSSGTALVVAKSRAVAEHFGELKTKTAHFNVRDANAAQRGRAEGSQVDVGRRAVATNPNNTARIA